MNENHELKGKRQLSTEHTITSLLVLLAILACSLGVYGIGRYIVTSPIAQYIINIDNTRTLKWIDFWFTGLIAITAVGLLALLVVFIIVCLPPFIDYLFPRRNR